MVTFFCMETRFCMTNEWCKVRDDNFLVRSRVREFVSQQICLCGIKEYNKLYLLWLGLLYLFRCHRRRPFLAGDRNVHLGWDLSEVCVWFGRESMRKRRGKKMKNEGSRKNVIYSEPIEDILVVLLLAIKNSLVTLVIFNNFHLSK